MGHVAATAASINIGGGDTLSNLAIPCADSAFLVLGEPRVTLGSHGLGLGHSSGESVLAVPIVSEGRSIAVIEVGLLRHFFTLPSYSSL